MTGNYELSNYKICDNIRVEILFDNGEYQIQYAKVVSILGPEDPTVTGDIHYDPVVYGFMYVSLYPNMDSTYYPLSGIAPNMKIVSHSLVDDVELLLTVK